MVWSGSSTEVIEMASGCRLAARRLASGDVFGNCCVLEGKTVGRLVRKGESKALREGRAFLLRLKTGQRGRPQERVILPPEPESRQSHVGRAAGAVRKTTTGGKSRAPQAAMSDAQDLADQISYLQSQVSQILAAIGKLEHEIRVIQAV